MTDYQLHVCDICKMLDNDTTLKYCFYCRLCDAWICKEDTYKFNRRILALRKQRKQAHIFTAMTEPQ